MDDKKEAIATRITIVLLVLILTAAAGVFAYTLKLHGCYKNSIQVTAEIDDIAIDNQSNIQVTYKYVTLIMTGIKKHSKILHSTITVK